jgi:hypothetical protein
MGTFDNHIILYAKHWYGTSFNNEAGGQYLVNDLKTLMARFYGNEEKHIADSDVKSAVLSAFDRFYQSGDRLEALKEAFGWRYGRDGGMLDDREAISVMVGKLCITDGNYAFLKEKYEDVCFTRDKKGCDGCHRANKEENDYDYCNCKKVLETA